MNDAQKIYAEKMKLATFNEFNGEAVVKSLEEHPELWRSFVFGRYDGYSELITLRDLPDNYMNADTLYVLVPEKMATEFVLMAQKWNADELDEVGEKEASDKLGTSRVEGRLFRIWWD